MCTFSNVFFLSIFSEKILPQVIVYLIFLTIVDIVQ